MADRILDVRTAVPSEGDVAVGRLYLHRGGRGESSTFQYDSTWLARAGGYAIEPRLPLLAGPFQTPPGQALFGALADSAPDRWGVELARRSERRRAEARDETPRRLAEADFLLAVKDDLRQGALRLFDREAERYLAPRDEGIPHLLDIARLLSASVHLERDAESDEELQLLLAAGSSLGGARPKATVADGSRLYIAKFPRVERDSWSVVVWEYVAIELARAAGIAVPATRLETVDGHAVLLVERFDRDRDERLGYVSALTMLEARDRDVRTYVDIAEVIEVESPRTSRDLAELWRRIAFSILVSNTDDHLRNHGFLRAENGWTLSAAFDINPDPDSQGLLSTAIDDPQDRRAEIETLVAASEVFRVQDPRRELSRLLDATDHWEDVARRHGVASEIPRLRPAFEHEQRAAARRLVRG